MVGLLILVMSAVSQPAPVPLQQGAFCEAADIQSTTEVQSFLSDFQSAVARGDRDTVISMIRFPVGYGIPGGPAELDQKDFTEAYDRIFNKELRSLLARQAVKDLYCSTVGLAIGQGQVWFGRPLGSDGLKVTALYLSKYGGAGVESMADTEKLDRSFARLRHAVEQNDRTTVAAMIHYPLSVYTQVGVVKIRTKDDLLRRYDFVFTPSVKHNLAETRLTDLFARSTGIGTKSGIVWFGSPPADHRAWTPKIDAIFDGT